MAGQRLWLANVSHPNILRKIPSLLPFLTHVRETAHLWPLSKYNAAQMLIFYLDVSHVWRNAGVWADFLSHTEG